ncbi:MAG: hypothetical protein D6705_05975 [Deltaproteobacteria bacterium]|nr:MAG: hypothetical protein D6705_05975 [Deltaproteobacteria bacterium]
MNTMGRRVRNTAGFALALALGATLPAHAEDACTDDGTVCWTRTKGAAFVPGKRASRRDKRRRGRRDPGSLSVEIVGGRGSVFLNGRYVGTAPVSGITVPNGRNDLEIRDGMVVLASGRLSMPSGGVITLTVRAPTAAGPF